MRVICLQKDLLAHNQIHLLLYKVLILTIVGSLMDGVAAYGLSHASTQVVLYIYTHAGSSRSAFTSAPTPVSVCSKSFVKDVFHFACRFKMQKQRGKRSSGQSLLE